jgi:cytochrome d ubiquinol oxidase subunit II
VQRRYALARALVVVQTVGIFLGFGAAQFPYLIAPKLTFADAAAPDHILWGVLGVLGVGAVLLLPAFVWLYSVFKGRGSATTT